MHPVFDRQLKTVPSFVCVGGGRARELGQRFEHIGTKWKDLRVTEEKHCKDS
jgi:hypothetical protein